MKLPDNQVLDIRIFRTKPGEVGNKPFYMAWVYISNRVENPETGSVDYQLQRTLMFNTYPTQEDTIENLLDNIKKEFNDALENWKHDVG